MGAFVSDTPRLLWLCAFLLVAGLVTTYQVSAESAKEDSDLVFDNLEQTYVKNRESHHRISRDAVSGEVPLESSPPVEEHWLSTTVNRLKRSINSFLSNKNEDGHSRTRRKLGRVTRQDPAGQQEAGDYDEDDDYDEITPNGGDEDDNGDAEDYENGLNNTGDAEEDEDEEEVDLEQQQVEEEEEQLAQTGGYDVAATVPTPSPETGNDRTENYFTNGNSSKPAHRHNESVNSDDEDLGGVSGSGEVESEPPLLPPPDHPVYFRMSLTVSEPFVDEFEDRNSFKYRDFTEDLVDGIEDLYREVPGTQSATVIKIQKREADAFTSLATVDLGSVGFSDHQVIRDTIYNQIEDQHRIGSVTVLPDDFQFRAFEARPQRCEGTDLPCQSGECVPATARCNGQSDCSDGSDEAGCQPFPPVTNVTTVDSPNIDQDLGSGDGETRSESSKCRADDIVTCSDGSRTICSDHVCDGVRHCDDGGDEEDCPTDCAEGEFICDISRCIHINKRCDGVKDCTDGTDERECVQCQSNEVKCDNKCVPPSKRCDGVPDCTNRADETNCPDSQFQCRPGEYSCGDGNCILPSQRCDGRADCRSGQDERNCTEPACSEDQVRCEDGSCIVGKKCDGLFDCIDGSDEQGCTFCSPDQFACSGGGCIQESFRCDHVPHCSDGSDEQNCVYHCPADQFRCVSDNLCLDMRRRCDNYTDCPDQSDEVGCPRSSSRNDTCSEDQFDCGDNCIEKSFRCDGYEDCNDGRDETGCPTRCGAGQFECISDKNCIPDSLTCNGNDDCNDGSDEVECPPSRSDCTPNEFRCDDGSCIPNYMVCDGSPQCVDSSDERRCPCRSDQFQCLNGTCIPGNYRCNRRIDCSDRSDEYNCPTEPPPYVPEYSTTPRPPQPQPISCPAGYYPCHSGDKCIFMSQLCDGKVDCHLDMSDETSCPGPSDGLNLKTYPTAQDIKENREVVFQCRDEGPLRARVRWTRPNGQPLPPGSRDNNGRLEMPNIKVEHSGSYLCEAVGYPPSTPGAQVSVQLQVDRWIPPPTRPPTACGLQEATCSNGDCISKNLVCDGRFDCTDGSDESRCNPNGCEPNEFRCANKKCILKTWRCDSDDDCGDMSDEENCATNPPGSLCAYHQFACHSNNQCIPRSYHCDVERDCVDGSDELGCSKPVIAKAPPPMVTLSYGSVFEISCQAVGVPTPEISWRLNWGHIPPKCRTTSVNGVGTLICPDIQTEDQGAYSCEAINIKGTLFAVPDTILVVTRDVVCPAGYFNEEAKSEADCIKCFCFGQSTKCRSADLFIYQFQPPFDTLKLLGVRVDPATGVVEIRDEPIYRNAQPQLTSVGRNGVHSVLPPYGEISQSNLVPYFAMPENYHGNQLKSYGGSLRFNVLHHNRGYPVAGPTVILAGNGYTLLHQSPRTPQSGRDERIEVRFFTGEWVKKSETYPETLATREEIMMALADIDNILIKLQYNDGPLNTTISNIEMDSAAAPNSGLGAASYVEECECPTGYTGTSCENCADGYVRHKSGPWLGRCFRQQPETCAPGTYGDPSRGIPCEICPCPLTSPSNQFARTCSLGSDGGVTCDCPPGYVGRRCEQCAAGYSGNPNIPGDSCRPSSYCNSAGALAVGGDDRGRCQCKDYVDGAYCDTCKPNTFHLSTENQFGCIACFCMGVTRQCTSSNWYRDQISTGFTNSRNDFKLIDSENRDRPIEQGITLNQEQREIVYSNFGSSNIHYWSLPSRYLGDKISSYGGYLRYTVRYVPVPGGQSSRNSAADVELVSDNQINLLYFAREQAQPTGSAQTFVVPLLEQYWQRSDGQKADREHLLMALADLKAIYIKATYNTNTRETALISVSLDIANERNTGSSERALAVEQCHCPPGYKGLSCEDCDVGYTRAEEGIYLGLCEPCSCNGNSNECDPETGICSNCNNFTTGESCEQCLPGYEGDPANGVPCRYRGGVLPCNCDSRGSVSNECYNGACRCKTNVEGHNCNRCRVGTFGLNSSSIEGCQVCFCSGVAQECSESNFYVEQIPSQLIDPERHGFTLTDQYQRERINNGFQLNIAMNEIGYNFRPSTNTRWYWSLPRDFTGNQIRSYGGKLEFTQRYTERPQSRYIPDQDVIIIGRGITIYWTNPQSQVPNTANKVSVSLTPSDNWQRLESNQGPRPASREDIISVLANIEAILIRAQQSSDTESAYLSDITLDTAVEQYTGQDRAGAVEVCRCPPGYRGTSCESCASGYYKDHNDYRTGPLGSCSRCPCNSNEQSCNLGPDNRVVCNCLPGYTGRNCEEQDRSSSTPPPWTTTQSPPPPPTIQVTIVAPKIEIYEVGSSLRFNCSARSIRDPGSLRVYWSKDGSNLPSQAIDDGRGLLVITDLRISDSGRYICQASDGWSIVTEDISVNVGPSRPEPPRVAISPPYLDVQENQMIEFLCAPTGNPQPDLRVIRRDGQQINPAHSFENGVFRIQRAQKSDESTYQCIARNSAGTHTADVEVRIRENSVSPIVRVEISPSYFNGVSGETVTLRCQAPRTVGTTFRWTRQNGPLPYSSRESNGILTIYEAKPEDSGMYVCTVTTYSGTRGSNTAEVRISGSNSEGVYPTASVTPERITISQGSSTELRCDAGGVPVPTIKWTKLGSELSSNTEQRGPILIIRNAQVTDRGVYVCVSSNSHGLAQASTIVEVNRLEVPILSISPEATQMVTAGNSAMLHCRIEAGIPAPTLTWTRPNGVPLGSNVEQMSGGTLRFSQITVNEGGEYICTAVNEAGRTTAIANIVVQTPPQIWTVPSEDIVTRRLGEHVKLECHGTGNPPPTVEWSKYGATPRDSYSEQLGSLPVKTVAVHEIARLSREDEGLYICQGRNNAGVVEKRIQLVIESLPTRGDIVGNRSRGEDSTNNDINPGFKDFEPTRPRPQPRPSVPSHTYDEKFTAPVGTRAELRCHINNNYDPEPIYVNWERADNSSLPTQAFIRSGTLYIDNVQPSAAGEYRCLGSYQSTGQIVFSLSAHLEVISPPRITLTPQRQVVHPGDDAYIQCSATGQQPITITWSPMGRTLPASVHTRDGLIQFNNIQLSDAGRYRCTAVNSAGEADAVADVLVEENIHKPAVTAENREQTAPIGSSVTLRCRAHSGIQANNIRWFRERLPLPASSRVNGEYLHLFNLQQDDQGRYFCEIPTQEGTSSDYIDLQISWPNTVTTTPPYLQISSPEGNHRVGESIDVNCQSSESGVITTWSKLGGWLADNVQNVAGNLRIRSLRPENAGTYRCEATGHQGVYHKDYNLNVIEDLKDEAPIEIKTAPQGSTVVMECKTDLEEPVNYLWSKPGGSLPNYVDLYSRSIQLNDVSSTEAGTFLCSASNNNRNIDVPIVLVVTGIVPYFSQAPTSFVSLPTLPDAYIQFNFEILFKPQNSDGLILYNGNKGNDRSGDFISLSLMGAVPEFRFNLGNGVTIVKGDRPLALDQWHTIKIIRNRKKAIMYVDDQGPFIGNAEGKYIGLDLTEDLYVGGVPDFAFISPEANAYTGFVGCISRLKIGHNHQDILKQGLRKVGITTCETCSENKCQNQGVCQEALATEGYTCICPSGFSGPTCNKLKGEACSPYACGSGRCVDNENSFECLCPLGRSGRRCEREITINEPAFKNGAYIAYPTPKPQRRLKVSLKAKPNDVSDGILLYCGETDEGDGDFASLAIKDRHLEFRFDVGKGPTIIRSDREIVPGEVLALTASRSLSEGRLLVNGEVAVGRSAGNHKALNLLTPLYIGGYDKQNVKINPGVGVDSGFNGCISDINVSGLDLNLVESAADAANVEECTSLSGTDVDNEIGSPQYSHENVPQAPPPAPYDTRKTGCSSSPCRNDGNCYPISPVEYKCSCLHGYSGRDCEIAPNQCDQLIPCQNGGTCNGTTTQYQCSCSLGFTGTNCEQRTQLRNDAHFDGRGYLEFDQTLLDHSNDGEREVIAIELSTNSSDGLIFWQGQTPNEDGQGQDYISLGIVNGYLEFSYDLGAGPAIIRNRKIRVNDGQRHTVVLMRKGIEGSIEIDNTFLEEGTAREFTTTMNCNGNLYLGGVPNLELMTGGKFTQGFNGCIHAIELQNSKGLDFGTRALSGVNVKPCSSFNDIFDNFDENDLVN